jgi:Asp-tRNA(Asn)/Glu-tRNA(Gln) amidotransferase A subunit family amidase
VRRVFKAAIAALEEAGVAIVRDDPGLTSSVQTWGAIATAEARYSESRELDHEREFLTDGAVEFLEWGEQISAGHYIEAQFARDRIFRAYADLFARTGAVALLTPTVGCEAFPHGTHHPETIGDVAIGPPLLDWPASCTTRTSPGYRPARCRSAWATTACPFRSSCSAREGRTDASSRPRRPSSR